VARHNYERQAAEHLRQAQRLLEDAKGRSRCRDVPALLAMAAEHVGAADANRRAITRVEPGYGWRHSPRTKKLGGAIRRATKSIHLAASGFGAGPCVRNSPYDR